MSIDSEIILVTALIRLYMKEHVVRILHDLPERPGFTFTTVRGQGRGRGQGGAYVFNDSDLTYHQFLEPRLVCRSGLAGEICGRIASAAWAGTKGDECRIHDAGPYVRTHQGNRPAFGAAR